MNVFVSDTLSAFAHMRNSQRIPNHLRQENPQRNGTEFDPNRYFEVLTHLRMADGFVLDYEYSYSGARAQPLLYARRENSTHVMTANEIESWRVSTTLSHYLVADGTPKSFIELVAFDLMADQFYLYWDAIQPKKPETCILTRPLRLDSSNPTEIDIDPNDLTQEQIDQFQSLSVAPSVTLTHDVATVEYCHFSNVRGMMRLRNSFSRQAPHLLYDAELIGWVENRIALSDFSERVPLSVEWEE